MLRLPIEIILEIFEIAALTRPDTCNTLMLVSHAAYAVVEPFAYNARVLRTPADVRVFESFMGRCPAPILALHIKAIAIDLAMPGLWTQLLLAHLPGLQHLAVTSAIDLPGNHSVNSLRTLDVLYRDDDAWNPERQPCPQALQCFTNLTHLRIGQLPTQSSSLLIEDPTVLPSLTHLAFATLPPGSHVHALVHLRHACLRILAPETRPKLQLLVACGAQSVLARRPTISLASIENDRFVLLAESEHDSEESRLHDWVERTRNIGTGDKGFWNNAEMHGRLQMARRALTAYMSLTT
ncbi:hypothetical protein EXIGLDRAFT_775231 [Exidia glandulosa HHB12029]|uniref:Uncharacterized protein n=1 Tax=Exidia glandulosa HHB12029 TaxID=1314781 RepID=A0A165DZR5_EXIGL|nr:hypothetical protein EXIGLDRAFT_775231 [Exidia glandulosa HHB12029]